MSTSIIDQIAAIRIPANGADRTRDLFILASKGGDSNCFDSLPGGRCGKRASRWSPIAVGGDWQCLSRACDLAGGFCGGAIRFAKGTDTPEAFIRVCRKALESAPAFDSPLAVFAVTQSGVMADGCESLARMVNAVPYGKPLWQYLEIHGRADR